MTDISTGDVLEMLTVNVDLVIWDLDSTLADTRHRRDFMPPRESWSDNLAWQGYSMQCAEDAAIEGTHNLFAMLREVGYIPVILTGRLACAEGRTKYWLKRHGLAPAHLIMRPDVASDLRPEEWKRETVARMLSQGFRVRLAIDDHPGTAAMFKQLGIPTLVVRPPVDEYADMAHL